MDDKTPTPISSVQHETIEPVGISATGKDQPVSTWAKPITRDSSTSSLSATKKLQTKRATSATNSPIPSRESSPVRPNIKPSNARSATGSTRPRKNSHQDVSPSRPGANPPSAAATQRALSAASTPSLYPSNSDLSIKAPIPQKPSAIPEIRETLRWPISPRLRSPPPINRPSPFSPRKFEQEPSSINVQKTSQPVEQQEGKQATTDSEVEESLLGPGMRTPARGASGTSSTLETVQEISQPNTPREMGLDGILEKTTTGTSLVSEPDSFMDSASNASNNSNKTIRAKPSVSANESGSESGGKGEIKMRSTSAAPQVGLRSNAPSTKSSITGGIGRGKAGGEGSTRNMTVETETVSSIPQVALGGAVGGGNNGSLRAKPSSETIRPKKEKKKTARKAPSVTSGTASSKADIFEAKVASAVDEANSSDSEETFVYESNPPDVSDRPRRFHSRTPSATSMASQIEQRNGSRSVLDGHHSVAMKKSMKFANSYNSNGPEAPTGEDDGKGTARSSAGTGRGTTHHHHLGGRWSRNGGNGHPSLFDNESPFPNATKSKNGVNPPRHSSRPTSPRITNMRMAPNGKRSPIAAGYDLDDGADDELTPLIISSVRSGRSGRRRQVGSIRQLEHQGPDDDQRSCLSRVAGCIVLTFMILFVIVTAVGFILATTQPLTELKIVALKNVLASEQDIIFDLKVQARNPNLVVVTIDQADLVIFARSKYAGTDAEWWRRPQDSLRRALRIRDNLEDPPLEDGDPTKNQNLEIGHVWKFDSPLAFDGSPFHDEKTNSLGQIRINHPGNHTIPSGSERWGRVLQHEFELIVRGTLKYSLPLSAKIRLVSVEGRVTVQPNAADQDPDLVHVN